MCESYSNLYYYYLFIYFYVNPNKSLLDPSENVALVL